METENQCYYSIKTDRHHARDAIKGVLSTIFFHRLFGPIEATTKEFLAIPYPVAIVNNPEDSTSNQLNTLIDNKIAKLLALIDSDSPSPSDDDFTILNSGYNSSGRHDNDNEDEKDDANHDETSAMIIVEFLDRKTIKRNTLTWFGKTEEDILWESWNINVTVVQNMEKKDMAAHFRKTILEIVEMANLYKDHIPQITKKGASPFIYHINVQKGIPQ